MSLEGCDSRIGVMIQQSGHIASLFSFSVLPQDQNKVFAVVFLLINFRDLRVSFAKSFPLKCFVVLVVHERLLDDFFGVLFSLVCLFGDFLF